MFRFLQRQSRRVGQLLIVGIRRIRLLGMTFASTRENHSNTYVLEVPKHLPTRPRRRSKKRFNRYSDKSPLPLPSCQCSMATVHSTSWSTLMETLKFLWNGVMEKMKVSAMPSKFN